MSEENEEGKEGKAKTPEQNVQEKKPVPYNRFWEVNEKAKSLQERLDKIEAENKIAKEKALAEQNKWQELAELRAKELQDKTLENVRLKIASAVELPPALIDRLKGDTPEEIKNDALSLVEMLQNAKPKDVKPAPKGGKEVHFDFANATPQEIREYFSK